MAADDTKVTTSAGSWPVIAWSGRLFDWGAFVMQNAGISPGPVPVLK